MTIIGINRREREKESFADGVWNKLVHVGKPSLHLSCVWNGVQSTICSFVFFSFLLFQYCRLHVNARHSADAISVTHWIESNWISIKVRQPMIEKCVNVIRYCLSARVMCAAGVCVYYFAMGQSTEMLPTGRNDRTFRIIGATHSVACAVMPFFVLDIDETRDKCTITTFVCVSHDDTTMSFRSCTVSAFVLIQNARQFSVRFEGQKRFTLLRSRFGPLFSCFGNRNQWRKISFFQFWFVLIE